MWYEALTVLGLYVGYRSFDIYSIIKFKLSK